MHLVGIREDAFLAVRYQGIFLDAVPQFAGDFEKFLSTLIAFVMLHHFVEAIVRGFVFVGRSHSVPRNSTACHMVESIEETCDVKWMVVGCRHGDGEAYTWGSLGHQRNHRRHVMARPLGTVPDGRLMGAAVVLRRAAGVAEEQHIHYAALRDTRDVL